MITTGYSTFRDVYIKIIAYKRTLSTMVLGESTYNKIASKKLIDKLEEIGDFINSTYDYVYKTYNIKHENRLRCTINIYTGNIEYIKSPIKDFGINSTRVESNVYEVMNDLVTFLENISK